MSVINIQTHTAAAVAAPVNEVKSQTPMSMYVCMHACIHVHIILSLQYLPSALTHLVDAASIAEQCFQTLYWRVHYPLRLHSQGGICICMHSIRLHSLVCVLAVRNSQNSVTSVSFLYTITIELPFSEFLPRTPSRTVYFKSMC